MSDTRPDFGKLALRPATGCAKFPWYCLKALVFVLLAPESMHSGSTAARSDVVVFFAAQAAMAMDH